LRKPLYMKKLFLLSILLVCAMLSYASHVSQSTASTVGYNFLSHKTSGLSATDLKLAYTGSNGGNTLYYIFSTDHSFVMVSAEDGATPIIGYSTDRAFHGDKIPATVKGFFEDYDKQITYIIEKNVTASAEIATKWSDLIANRVSGSTAKTTSVSPLLGTLSWDQTQYYNDYCPADAAAPYGYGGHTPTGCVATATAQVMKFWSWPTTGEGFHSYATASYGTLSANFGSTTYNWSAMPNSVSTTNDAVATLMYQVGVSVDMDYTAEESGSYVVEEYCPITNNAEYALKTYFNYDGTSVNGHYRSDYTDDTWISMLETDLTAGRPVIYFGAGTAGGHCFVFDGFDATNEMHVNWGWGGEGPDGYFTIDALNPPALGTGGGAGGFNSDQGAIFGIKPNGGGTGGGGGGTTVTTDSIVLYDYVTVTPNVIGYGQSFSVTTNVANTGTSDFAGDYCAAAFDASTGTFITFIDSITGATLPAGYVYSSDMTFSTPGLFSLLPGTYEIGIYYRVTGGSWVYVGNAGLYTNFSALNVVNDYPFELYDALTPSPSPLVQGAPGSVTCNIANFTGVDFSGAYDVSLYNLDGSFACTIQTMYGMSLTNGSTYPSDLTFSTTNVTAAPGTYLLALQDSTAGYWYLVGSGAYENPTYVNVIAPPLSPDMYEVNDTTTTAYPFTLTYVSNVASKITTGSNLHVSTDQDYYKTSFAAGYNYSITARVNDLVSTDDGLSYTTDVLWSYSTDGGATWSAEYDDAMPGTINFTGGTGGNLMFHVTPHYAGNTGTYVLKFSATRISTTDIPAVNLDAMTVYPNPASQMITVDLTNTGINGTEAAITDIAGRKVYSTAITNQSLIQLPVANLPEGIYLVVVTTDAGVVKKKITVMK